MAEAERELAELAASDPAQAALDPRLGAVIGGEPRKDNAERLVLAQLPEAEQAEWQMLWKRVNDLLVQVANANK